MQTYRVCVADGCIESASVLSKGLAENEYEVVCATTGADALRVCGKGDIDLIMVDVNMPDVNGYDICQRLKQAERTRDTVVFLVTDKGKQEDIARGFQLGAAEYITKPYNLPIVMVRVESAIRRRDLGICMREHQEAIRDCVYTDELTGLRNSRFLLERLQEEVEKAHRYDYPVSCVAFDLEEVKAIDDEFGAASLDDLLVEIGMAIRNFSRTFDVLARYDGTVFAAVLPHTPLEQAMGYAQKILTEVETTTFSDPCFPTTARLTAGIAACRNGSALGAEYVLGEAMRGLLKAKSMPCERVVGRNLTES